MKRFRRAAAALLLTCALWSVALAGEMDLPGVTTQGEMDLPGIVQLYAAPLLGLLAGVV